MNKYKVYFDYEEEDAVEIIAAGPQLAKMHVASMLINEHKWDGDDVGDVLDSLNVEEVAC